MAICYFLIPLAYFGRRRPQVLPSRLLLLFSLFILFCGSVHLLEALIFWNPLYRASGLMKLCTAVVSAATLFALVSEMPRFLQLRSHRELEDEVVRRRAAEKELRATQRSLEREVEQRTKELRHSNLYLQQFAPAVSHDLKQPMRTIRSYSELTLEEQGERLDDEGRGWLETIVGASQRLEAHLTGLLALSRIDAEGARPELTSVSKSVEAVRLALSQQIEETGATLEVEERLPQVYADPAQLAGLLQNLVSNSLKYAGDAPPRVRLRGYRGGDGTVLEVRDHGIGVQAQQLDEMFRLFRRLHPDDASGGSGMGLALCRRIMERHGGTIEAVLPEPQDGDDGRGLVFRIRFPEPRPIPEEEASPGVKLGVDDPLPAGPS